MTETVPLPEFATYILPFSVEVTNTGTDGTHTPALQSRGRLMVVAEVGLAVAMEEIVSSPLFAT